MVGQTEYTPSTVVWVLVGPPGRGRPGHRQSPRPPRPRPRLRPRPGCVRPRPPPSRGGVRGPACSWCCSAVFVMELAPRNCRFPPPLLLLLLLLGLSTGKFRQKMYQWPVPPSLSRDESLLSEFVLFKANLFSLVSTSHNYIAFELHSFVLLYF